MVRDFMAVVLATFVLGMTAQACAPASDVAPESPAAQATMVRRTAVAEVQQIIANNPTATPQPAVTPTPVPTCPNAIWWNEVHRHVGESRMIQGKVVGIRPAPGGASALEIGQPYPDPQGLTVLVPSAPADLSGKTVCFTGKITKLEGIPTIQLRDPTLIQAVD